MSRLNTIPLFASYDPQSRRLLTPERQTPYTRKRALGMGGSQLRVDSFSRGLPYSKNKSAKHCQTVVIKWGTNPNGCETLRNEVSFLQKLDHPGIIKPIRSGQFRVVNGEKSLSTQVYEAFFGQDRGMLDNNLGNFVVMPKCLKDLADVNRCYKLPDSSKNGIIKLLNFMEQLLSVMVYLEENNVVHNDIKPSNILVTEKGKYVLADFGSATEAENLTPGGTYEFMAPEKLLGAKHYDGFKSDMFSFAATCYFIITGSTLGQSELAGDEDKSEFLRKKYKQSFFQLRAHALNKTEETLKDQGALVRLLERMMSRDWESRPSAQQALERVRAIHNNYLQSQAEKSMRGYVLTGVKRLVNPIAIYPVPIREGTDFQAVAPSEVVMQEKII